MALFGKKKEESKPDSKPVAPTGAPGSGMIMPGTTYLFQVAKKASRQDVSRAIKAVYGIVPLKVRLINVSGKSRKQRNVQGWTADWKKAMVTLPADQKIDLYEGV